MKKIVMTGPGKSHVVEVPKPEVTDDSLLVKVTYTGMCHSEWYPWSVAKAGDTLDFPDRSGGRETFSVF